VSDCNLYATLLERTAITAVIEERVSIAAVIGERDTISAEIIMGGMTGEEREKLDSIEWGARRGEKDFVRLAYAVEKSTGGGGETGGGGGVSTNWIGTAAFQETIDVYVPHPTWRANGYIEWDFSADFENSTGSPQTATFKLQRAYPPATTFDTAASVFGAIPTFVDIAGASWTSAAIPAGAGVGTFTFNVRVRALGHTGEVYKHAYSGTMIYSDLSGSGALSKSFVGRLATSGASAPYDGLDVTEDLEIRAVFKMDGAWAASGDDFIVTSAGADFVPRSGHPY